MENEFSFTHKVESHAQEILIQKCICDFPATERAAGSYFLLNLFISFFILFLSTSPPFKLSVSESSCITPSICNSADRENLTR